MEGQEKIKRNSKIRPAKTGPRWSVEFWKSKCRAAAI
jgi:hypothetical protein